MQTKMLIGGAQEAGTETEEAVLNPRTGELIVKMPEADMDQVNRAVAAARGAFPGWARTTPGHRSGLLLALADAIEARAEEFVTLESLNCGKPINEVRNEEVPAVADCFRYFAGAVRNMHGPLAGEYMEGHTSMIRRDPIGVVASIAPWNYPMMMMAWKLAPALAGGNTVVMKPSEQTPLTALLMAEIIAGIFPEGVVNVIVGQGATVGNALINHPQVDMVSITGDVATGRKVLQAASKSVKRTHLELGGKAPVIVMDDADLGRVVEGLRAFGYYNAGQDCTAACRIYAGPKVYENLVADLSSAVSSIVFDNADDTKNEIPPLISQRQRDRVASFVQRASELKHIEVTTGGAQHEGSGFYYRPTVIAGALQEDEIVQREVFGPVVSVTRFDDPDTAVAWANDSQYGLASSVWTENIGRALDISSRLQYGCTWVNTHFMLVNEMPHGGLKQSGYGKDMSMYALEDYTVARHVMIAH
ncbi:gamma-aminobutyraldehyde dehydrogenase [Alloyangia pacifica]|uniref:gamma-aminobutyraldehyde dehydrogenase n=1 Tax=Alloyangia pacifica TaxID=311180 RepID=UPI001CFDAC5F|nr:gamma-aminobutyraldehyde dehydrogenase [Alloyangia pacifica]